MKLRLMTYNIQHGHLHLGDHIDLTKVCGVIREYDPDIIGLNEVRGRGVRDKNYTAQAEAMAAQLGYHCYFGRSIYVGGTEPYGNAILSKYPIIEGAVIRIPDPVTTERIRYFEPRSICRCVVEISAGHVPFAVYSSHFGLSPAEHEHAVSTAVTLLRDEALPHALMGDFNMTPENALLGALNRAMVGTDEILSGKLSYPSDAPSSKIDYIYVSRGITVSHADIPQIIASDHCPVYADIEL